MSEKLRGSRQAQNIWIKTEGIGNKHAYDIKLELERNNAISLSDFLDVSTKKYQKKKCLGTRKILERRKIESNGKTLEKLNLGEYEWKTYEEVQNQVKKVTGALRNLGLSKGDRVLIFAETREEWLISMIGCLRLGLTVATLYTTLNDEGVVHGINETEIVTIFTSFDLVPRIAKLLPKCDKIRNIIVFEDQLEGMGTNHIAIEDSVNIIPFKKFINIDASQDQSKEVINPDDNAIIIYTSGTTGRPKGVVASHKSMFYAMIAFSIQTNFTSNDRYLAYLPLAHSMELLSEVAMITLGVSIAYSSAMTLTSNSAKILKGTVGDAVLAKPTAIATVPLILDRIIKGVKQQVQNQGKLKEIVFNNALHFKQKYPKSITSKFLDEFIFDKVKANLGGCVKQMYVGSAPVSDCTFSMIRAIFNCSLQNGYGCSETLACAAAMDADDKRLGQVGPPCPFTKLKLIDWDEGGYKTTDLPRPRGEIIIGGPCVTKEYFKMPGETNESFYEENGTKWFRTGDIGEVDETGVFYVIDRKKDLAKLKHGEYVSLGFVESRLKTSQLVENICLFADGNENYTVAVIVPNETEMHKLAQEFDIPNKISVEELCQNEKVTKLFINKLSDHGNQCGLSKWDIPQAIFLSNSQWTPEAGLLTAALKVKRKAVEKEYIAQIKTLYNKV